jgi:hypothetical protein
VKEFIIRKHPTCAHWVIFQQKECEANLVYFREVAHCEIFSDILVLINLYEFSDDVI